MKSGYIICAIAIAASVSSYAQSLQLPDDATQNAPAQLPSGGDAVASDSAKEEVKALYSVRLRSRIRQNVMLSVKETASSKEGLLPRAEEYEKALQINDRSIIGRYNKAVALLGTSERRQQGTDKDPRARRRTAQ